MAQHPLVIDAAKMQLGFVAAFRMNLLAIKILGAFQGLICYGPLSKNLQFGALDLSAIAFILRILR